MIIRTITEILKEAHFSNDLQVLINLWNEIVKNKYHYPLSEIRFANERISELALSVMGKDFDNGKFYYELKSQLDA